MLEFTSNVHTVRGDKEGDVITLVSRPPSPPTISASPGGNRNILLTINPDSLTEWIDVYESPSVDFTSNVKTTSYPREAIGIHDTGDIGAGNTRYFKVLAGNNGGTSDFSNTVSSTATSGTPAPGKVDVFTVVNNNDGTVDINYIRPDFFATIEVIEIWRQSPAGWVSLKEIVPEGTNVEEVIESEDVPASTGAVKNSNGEFGFRLRRTNAQGSSFSDEQWVAVTNPSGSLTSGVLGSVVVVSTSSLRIPLTTAPTNYTSMQLEWSATGSSQGGSWSDVAGADSESDFTGGGYLHSGLAASTTRYYRLRVSDGSQTIYSNIVNGTTQAAPGAGLFFLDGFESGDRSHKQNGAEWKGGGGGGINPGTVAVKTTKPYAGSYSMEFHFPGGSSYAHSSAEQRFALGAYYDEVYIGMRMWIPSNYKHPNKDGGSDNRKFFVIWKDTYSEDCQIGLELWSGSNGTESSLTVAFQDENSIAQHRSGVGGFLSAPYYGTWVRWAMRFKVATATPTGTGKNRRSNGICEIWRNGTKIVSITDLANMKSGAGFRNGYILGWANGGFSEPTTFYIDDVAFSSTSAGIAGYL